MSRHYTRGGFGSRYKCPVCSVNVRQGDPHQRIGPFNAHPDCKVTCSLCGEQVTEPPIGRRSEVAVWLNQPVHAACKSEEQS